MATALALSHLTNVMKDKYNKDIPLLFNSKLDLWEYFKPATVEQTGEKKFLINMQTVRNESAQATSEGLALPTGGTPTYVQGTLYLKKLIAYMELNAETIDLTSGPDALVKGLPSHIKNTIDPFMDRVNAYMHLNGGTYICTAVSVNSQVITVDTTRFVRAGMLLQGYDDSNNHDATDLTVTEVNSDTTFTVTGTASSVDSATRFYVGNSWVTSGSKTLAGIRAPQGIEAIVDESDPPYGDFQGIDRATYTYNSAIVRDMSDAGGSAGTAGPITRQRIISLLDAVRKATGETPTFGYAGLGVINALYQMYSDRHQPTEVMPSSDGIPGGLSFQYGGTKIPIKDGIYCKANTLFFLNPKHIFKYNSGSFRWEDQGGWLTKVSGYDAFCAYYKGYVNFGTDWPQTNARLNDITESLY